MSSDAGLPGWAEIAPESGRVRYESLKQALSEAGFSGPSEFLPCEDESAFPDALERAKRSARAVRIADAFAVQAGSVQESYSAAMLTLRACDALDAIAGRWWPRNWTAEGVGRAAARDLKIVDLGGSALIVGATASARAAVYALAKVGYERFHLVDRDDEAAAALAGELGRALFKASFECAPKNFVTQLPGVFAIAVNASPSANADLLNELFHMNFLRPGAFWVELFPGPSEAPLLVEARGAGAYVELGSRVSALADAAWASGSLGLAIDPAPHAARLQAAAEGPSSAA